MAGEKTSTSVSASCDIPSATAIPSTLPEDADSYSNARIMEQLASANNTSETTESAVRVLSCTRRLGPSFSRECRDEAMALTVATGGDFACDVTCANGAETPLTVAHSPITEAASLSSCSHVGADPSLSPVVLSKITCGDSTRPNTAVDEGDMFLSGKKTAVLHSGSERLRLKNENCHTLSENSEEIDVVATDDNDEEEEEEVMENLLSGEKNECVEMDEEYVPSFFPATRPEFACRAGAVQQLRASDFADEHRARHLRSFQRSMRDWKKFHLSNSKNSIDNERMEAFVKALIEKNPQTSKEFDNACKQLRKAMRVAPSKQEILAAFERLFSSTTTTSSSNTTTPTTTATPTTTPTATPTTTTTATAATTATTTTATPIITTTTATTTTSTTSTATTTGTTAATTATPNTTLTMTQSGDRHTTTIHDAKTHQQQQQQHRLGNQENDNACYKRKQEEEEADSVEEGEKEVTVAAHHLELLQHNNLQQLQEKQEHEQQQQRQEQHQQEQQDQQQEQDHQQQHQQHEQVEREEQREGKESNRERMLLSVHRREVIERIGNCGDVLLGEDSPARVGVAATEGKEHRNQKKGWEEEEEKEKKEKEQKETAAEGFSESMGSRQQQQEECSSHHQKFPTDQKEEEEEEEDNVLAAILAGEDEVLLSPACHSSSSSDTCCETPQQHCSGEGLMATSDRTLRGRKKGDTEGVVTDSLAAGEKQQTRGINEEADHHNNNDTAHTFYADEQQQQPLLLLQRQPQHQHQHQHQQRGQPQFQHQYHERKQQSQEYQQQQQRNEEEHQNRKQGHSSQQHLQEQEQEEEEHLQQEQQQQQHQHQQQLESLQKTRSSMHLFEHLLKRKAIRTNSGVLVITVLTSPGAFSCPHNCHYCPNEPGQPRSYLSTEPAVLRANQNHWDAVQQFHDRATTLKNNGHTVDKIEVLVLGGTWSGYPRTYQEEFIRDLYYAANVFDAPQPFRERRTLEEEQRINETAECRVIGLTLETRPDFINSGELKKLRRFGCTRVQLGIQHVFDEILTYINRGCYRRDAIRAIRLLKNSGFKVDIHIMPDLPGSNPEKDLRMLFYLLSSTDLQADQWKLYPCEVTPYSEIEKWYKNGTFLPYAEAEDGRLLVELLLRTKAAVHPWIRLNRVVRDIPNPTIIGGNKVTNLRQVLLKELADRGLRCRCIRCREVKDRIFDVQREAVLKAREYPTNGGREIFLSFETEDEKVIFGFLRLRLPQDISPSRRDVPFRSLANAALLRELHVYGVLVAHGEEKRQSDARPQHAGLGRRLIVAAELIAMTRGFFRMAVIAGVGTREYYRRYGYTQQETYMVKQLSPPRNISSAESQHYVDALGGKVLDILQVDLSTSGRLLLQSLPSSNRQLKSSGRRIARSKLEETREKKLSPVAAGDSNSASAAEITAAASECQCPQGTAHVPRNHNIFQTGTVTAGGSERSYEIPEKGKHVQKKESDAEGTKRLVSNHGDGKASGCEATIGGEETCSMSRTSVTLENHRIIQEGATGNSSAAVSHSSCYTAIGEGNMARNSKQVDIDCYHDEEEHAGVAWKERVSSPELLRKIDRQDAATAAAPAASASSAAIARAAGSANMERSGRRIIEGCVRTAEEKVYICAPEERAPVDGMQSQSKCCSVSKNVLDTHYQVAKTSSRDLQGKDGDKEKRRDSTEVTQSAREESCVPTAAGENNTFLFQLLETSAETDDSSVQRRQRRQRKNKKERKFGGDPAASTEGATVATAAGVTDRDEASFWCLLDGENVVSNVERLSVDFALEQALDLYNKRQIEDVARTSSGVCTPGHALSFAEKAASSISTIGRIRNKEPDHFEEFDAVCVQLLGFAKETSNAPFLRKSATKATTASTAVEKAAKRSCSSRTWVGEALGSLRQRWDYLKGKTGVNTNAVGALLLCAVAVPTLLFLCRRIRK